ncbi:MAG TPA: biopolymer transporter ExbD, partial [Flavobacteriaceae bacterium]|nr:biopolymer transporter ExbD [Flavobacteriaceae bacterium]
MAQIESHDDGGGKKVRSKKNSTKVDMAPLVDLGFLLITFFMFAATSIKPNVMNL